MHNRQAQYNLVGKENKTQRCERARQKKTYKRKALNYIVDKC